MLLNCPCKCIHVSKVLLIVVGFGCFSAYQTVIKSHQDLKCFAFDLFHKTFASNQFSITHNVGFHAWLCPSIINSYLSKGPVFPQIENQKLRKEYESCISWQLYINKVQRLQCLDAGIFLQCICAFTHIVKFLPYRFQVTFVAV